MLKANWNWKKKFFNYFNKSTLSLSNFLHISISSLHPKTWTPTFRTFITNIVNFWNAKSETLPLKVPLGANDPAARQHWAQHVFTDSQTDLLYLYYTLSTVEPVDRWGRRPDGLAIKHDVGAALGHHDLAVTSCFVEEQIASRRQRRRRLDYCNDQQTRRQSHHGTTTPASWRLPHHVPCHCDWGKTSLSYGTCAALQKSKSH